MGRQAQPESSTITKKQSLGIAFSSLVGALAVFVVTIITSRVLIPQDNAQFLVFWSLMFGTFGALLGIQQEVTRARGAQSLSSGQRTGARVLPLAAGWGVAAGLLLLLTSPLWGTLILGEGYLLSVAVIAAGAVLYACHVAVVGSAAGAGEWTIFAWLGSWEALIRLALVALVALTSGALWGFQFAAIAPVLLWLCLLAVSRRGRELAAARADLPAAPLARTMGLSILTSAAYAVMVTGFPVILKVSEAGEQGSEGALILAAVILGISITRAPIMIPLQMFQGVAISAFLRQRHRPLLALLKPAAALLGLGLVGALAAYFLGPFLFGLLYSDYAGLLSAWTLAAFTLASSFLALAVLSGTATLAASKHLLYFAGWLLTVLVAVGILFLPLDLALRSALSLVVGPLVGAAVHVTGLALTAKEDAHV